MLNKNQQYSLFVKKDDVIETNLLVTINKLHGDKVDYTINNLLTNEVTNYTDYQSYLKRELKGFKQYNLVKYFDVLNGDISLYFYKNGNLSSMDFIHCGEWMTFTRKDNDTIRYLLKKYGLEEEV